MLHAPFSAGPQTQGGHFLSLVELNSVVCCRRSLFVMLDVQFCRLGCVVSGVMRVAMRQVRMVSGCLVVASLIVPGRFAMVPRRVLVVFGCFMVMLRCLF